MTPAERIRVYIAGDIYPKRGLVRRFLEDDGYAVVGTTISRKTMMAAIRKTEPDAVVVDEDLLVSGPGGGTLAKIRQAAPDAKVVVFTSAPMSDASAPAGADGYLEKGVGLSALTALLGRLFADDTARLEPIAALGAAGRTDVAASAPISERPARERVPVGAPPSGNGAGTTARVVAIAGGAILLVWGMIAMLATGGGPTPPPVDPFEGTEPSIIAASTLDDAYASLRGLINAIESGNYVLASIEAQELLDARRQARAEGFAITSLDAEITSRLGTVVGLLPLRVNTTLSAILGSLYPELPDEDVPGGGSDLFGPVFTGGTTGGTDGGDAGGTDGGQNDGGNGDTTNGNGGPGDGDQVDGGGPVTTLSPGDGRAWGQSHKPSHAGSGTQPPGGGPPAGGGPPPWANGNANGHSKHNG